MRHVSVSAFQFLIAPSSLRAVGLYEPEAQLRACRVMRQPFTRLPALADNHERTLIQPITISREGPDNRSARGRIRLATASQSTGGRGE
jgi:hypothetical protein